MPLLITTIIQSRSTYVGCVIFITLNIIEALLSKTSPEYARYVDPGLPEIIRQMSDPNEPRKPEPATLYLRLHERAVRTREVCRRICDREAQSSLIEEERQTVNNLRLSQRITMDEYLNLAEMLDDTEISCGIFPRR